MEAPPPSRSPWQRLYTAGHGLRRHWYARQRKCLGVPVVSVGNLHWGGTGKTPLVAALATHLREREWRVAILSRGYGRRSRGIALVSAGEGALLGFKDAGDEPVLLAEELNGVALVVGGNRYRAGLWALQHLDPAPDLLLLDDGFSHLQLWRDLDLLACPASDPFGGGLLLPSGRLREPLQAARHAHGVLLTGTSAGSSGELGDQLARSLRPYGFTGPGFMSQTRVVPEAASSAIDRGSPMLLVSGVAHPERVANTASENGFRVVSHLIFPDHYPYPRAGLRRIEGACRSHGASAVLTTTKDRVKLDGRLGVPLVELAIEAVPEESFWTWLDARLLALGARPRDPLD